MGRLAGKDRRIINGEGMRNWSTALSAAATVSPTWDNGAEQRVSQIISSERGRKCNRMTELGQTECAAVKPVDAFRVVALTAAVDEANIENPDSSL
jgi:hypothetical protein